MIAASERARRNIKAVRTARGLALHEVSDRLAVKHPMSVNTLSKLETGRRTVSVDDVVALAHVLETTVDVLLGPPVAPVCRTCGQEIPADA